VPVALDGELHAVARDPDIPTGAEISRAVSALSPEQREVFLLREVRGLSYEELSERLDLTPAAAGSLLARARKRVRDELALPGERPGKRPLFGLPGAWTALREALQPSALKVAGLVGAAAVAPGITIGLHGAVPKPIPPARVVEATSATVSRLGTIPGVPARPAKAAQAAAVGRQHVRSRRFTPAPPASAHVVAGPASTNQAAPAPAADPLPAVRPENGAVEPTATSVKQPRSVPSGSESDKVEPATELTDEAEGAVERAQDTAGDLVPTDQVPTVPEPPSVDQAAGNVSDAAPDLPGVSPPKLPNVPGLGG